MRTAEAHGRGPVTLNSDGNRVVRLASRPSRFRGIARDRHRSRRHLSLVRPGGRSSRVGSARWSGGLPGIGSTRWFVPMRVMQELRTTYETAARTRGVDPSALAAVLEVDLLPKNR